MATKMNTGKLPIYDDFKGTLAQGPDALLACIEFDHSVRREAAASHFESRISELKTLWQSI
jgi:hypothetical protein